MRKLGNPGVNQYIKRVSFIVMIRNNILKEKSEKICSKIHFLRGLEYEKCKRKNRASLSSDGNLLTIIIKNKEFLCLLKIQ